MTNGEMIQKVFNCEVCEPIVEDNIVHVVFADKKDSAIGFDWSWWNIEYKEPVTKNDLGVDCISRADVRSLVVKIDRKYMFGMSGKAFQDLYNRIDELPSITPQEPKIVSIAEIKYDEDKLKELVNKAVLTVSRQEPRCKECKWWKDSDGEYRRGCGAESKCPINSKKVYEGEGYCYMFSPKGESEET